MAKQQTHAELIYNYPLYSIKRFPTFLRYCKPIANKLAKQMGGGKLLAVRLLADMIWCNIRYGAMDSRDYQLFEFWKKSAFERNSFFTKRRYFRLIKHFDKETFCHPNGKAYLYDKYSDYVKRDWMFAESSTDEEKIDDFIEKHGLVLIKPESSEQGKGIRTIRKEDTAEINQLKEDRKKHPFLLEEVCRNCEELNRLNSSSLNTLRVFTIVNSSGEIEIPCVCLRCGVGNTVVDNWGSGGVSYPVDIATGVIYERGVDKKGYKHIKHPGTDVIMPGLVIPRFKEACEMAIDVIRKDMKVVYAGHDIAILPDRLELIEVNFPGGHDIFQAIDHIPKNKLMKQVYKAK